MKKKNWGRILWVTSLFLLLIVILLMIIDYKINYQYLTKNILYFYECDGNLCSSETKDENKLMFSKYECGEEECPYYKENIGDDYVILEYKNKTNRLLYNYREGKLASSSYETYSMLDSNHFIVTKKNKQGIINDNDKVIVELLYEQIGYLNDNELSGYNFENIIAKKEDKYGIISYKSGKIIEKFDYTENDLETLLSKLNQ